MVDIPVRIFFNDIKQIQGPLWFSYTEAFLTSLVVGLAESYFAAYSIHHGLSVLQSGLLISLPLIIAALMQFFLQSKMATANLSYFVQRALVIQASALVGLAVFTFFKPDSIFYWLLACYSFYWFGHFSIQPAWNRWISDIIPLESGQQYFSLRTRLSQIAILCGLFAGGYLLHLNVLNVDIEKIFFGLFVFSFFLKITTVYLFQRHPPQTQPLFLNMKNIKSLFFQNISFFKRYATFHTCVYLSASYVAGYLISTRQLTYLEFMVVMSGLFLGKILMTYYLNQTKVQINPLKLLIWGGMISAPLPILWPLSPDATTMFFVHVLSGIGWAGWEVGLSLYFFKNIHGDKKIELISLYNYVGVLTQVLGTVLGAILFKTILDQNFAYLFYLAGVLRFISLMGMRNTKLVA